MNGPKTYTPCNICGKPCTINMIGDLFAWICWDCTRTMPRPHGESA